MINKIINNNFFDLTDFNAYIVVSSGLIGSQIANSFLSLRASVIFLKKNIDLHLISYSWIAKETPNYMIKSKIYLWKHIVI